MHTYLNVNKYTLTHPEKSSFIPALSVIKNKYSIVKYFSYPVSRDIYGD